MSGRGGRRHFGFVRKLPSGRFQASYLGPDGRRRTAPETFGRKQDAEAIRAELPLSSFFFDVLYVDGTPAIDEPLSRRASDHLRRGIGGG